MTKTEALKLVFTVKAAYPVYYRNVTDRELEAMADIWIATLDGYSYNEAFTAVVTYLRSGMKEILQSPGQVVDEIEKLRAAAKPEGTLTPVTAWEQYVRPAIRDGLYHSEEHFAAMPEVVQEAIHSPGYLKELAMEPSETIDSVERSNFINRLYPTAVKRRAADARLPESVKALIEKRKLEAIESGRRTALESKAEEIPDETDETPHRAHTAQIEALERSLVG